MSYLDPADRIILIHEAMSDISNRVRELASQDQAPRQKFADLIKTHGGDWKAARSEFISQGAGSESDVFGDFQRRPEVKKLLVKYGKRLVAKSRDPKTRQAAWLLAQHADDDVKLQKQMKSWLKRAGQAGTEEHRLITDRVKINTGKPQVYNTQRRFPSGHISTGLLRGLAGGIGGLGAGIVGDVLARKAMKAAGIENKTTQDVIGTMSSGVVGGGVGGAVAGTGVAAGAAAGAAGAAGALGGWYAARGALKAYDKLTGSDMSQQKTNPFEIYSDYAKDQKKEQDLQQAEKERQARAASPEGQRRRAEMAAILRGETPPNRNP